MRQPPPPPPKPQGGAGAEAPEPTPAVAARAPPAQPKPHPMQVVETAKLRARRRRPTTRGSSPSTIRTSRSAEGRARLREGADGRQEQGRGAPRRRPIRKRRRFKSTLIGFAGTEREQGARRAGLARDAHAGTVQTPSQEEQDAKVRGSTTGASGALAFDGYVPRKGNGAIAEQQQHERSELPRGSERGRRWRTGYAEPQTVAGSPRARARRRQRRSHG